MPRSIRALVVAAVLGSCLLAVPSGARPAAAVGPLPACRLDDILTNPREYDSWSTTLVDWILMVGRDYRPPDLVFLSEAGVTGGGQVRRVALDDLAAMAAAARKDGTPLGNVSAYRSYGQQRRLFNDYVRGNGFDSAITFSARPGHSEHQLGLAIDFADSGSTDFASEEVGAGRWLARNAWKYGWLMSYPRGKKKLTCYRYEPWHYRYVGRDLAKAIHDSGLTIREYLWANYTLVDPTTGEPIASGSPEPSPSPAASSPASPPAASTPPPTPAASPGASSTATRSGGPVATPAPSAPGGIDPTALVAGAVVLAAIASLLALALRWRSTA
jgi:D-alanyl-D-alanine carboxypeptidase